ncbi:hypothetical protein [Rhodococcus sp. MALMAid1271]|uniref:hypothetical protein n=1 Tax=Rhodococcus sp. MALMAid1271 TaxID=3411744 RepID=UPI003BA0BCEA
MAIVQLALDLMVRTQMLGFTEDAASGWEPKIIRLQQFSIAGRASTHARRIHPRLLKNATWSALIVTAFTRLTAPPASA